MRELTVIVAPREFTVMARDNNDHAAGDTANRVVVTVGSGSFETWGQEDIILSEVPETFGDLD